MTRSFMPEISEAFIDQLIVDMDRLGKRPYAEIGVPMFLVAEDLSGTAPKSDPAASDSQLATLFSQAAEALTRRKPDLTPKDVARLAEVIADRHFLALATPPFSQIGDLHPEVD